jgi:hypothetical protein
MEGTRVITCACGRSFVARDTDTLRRSREETDHEVIWVAYIGDRFHHVCGIDETPRVE